MVLCKIITAAFLGLWSVGPTSAQEKPVDKCPCLYESQDEGECYSYSRSLSGSDLQPWPVASDQCLEALGIELRILPIQTFWAFCPYPNRTDVNYAEIISFLKSEPNHTVAKEIMQLFVDTGLFVPEGDGYTIADEILTESLVQLNCTEAINLCWAQLRVEMQGRAQKMNSLCSNLHQRQVSALQQEQADARLRLCDDAESVCEPLSSSVQEAKASGGDCANLAVLVGKEDLPRCANETTEATQSTSDADIHSVVSSFLLTLLVPSLLYVAY